MKLCKVMYSLHNIVLPNFLVWEFRENAQFLKILRKLSASIIFPHQEIRWNVGILSIVYFWKNWKDPEGLQSWKKCYRQNSRNQVKTVFLWNVLQFIFGSFLAQMSKFIFWVTGWIFAIRFKHFRDFLQIF